MPIASLFFVYDPLLSIDTDGLLDLVTVDTLAGRAYWLKNSGGTAPAWTSFLVGDGLGQPYSIFAATIDDDNATDIAVAAYAGNSVEWYRNGGGSPPTWSRRTITATAAGARWVRVADVDRDGRGDVLATSVLDNRVTWYHNDGASPVGWTPYVLPSDAASAATVEAVE